MGMGGIFNPWNFFYLQYWEEKKSPETNVLFKYRRKRVILNWIYADADPVVGFVFKVVFFLEGVVVSTVGWIGTERPSQSLWLSRKWKVNVIRCQRFQSRGKLLSKGSALVYSCELLFLSVFINNFSDLKRISILSMCLTKQVDFLLHHCKCNL